ncbi:hypothetical protein GQ55_7G297100 [Panicum hallii var. hallii]|uniref:Uncharacterized protein n=1 Tax=Panicum hallii var. hallii TaxID=1504633 RepID=A0A2T7D0K2_9POAL|nr:hypothetical protein GQ55_7G297100 [Panicum hallii var. hallii]
MPGCITLDGWWKECHRTVALPGLRTTRLPLSSSCASTGDVLLEFDDHAIRPEPSSRRRLPVSPTMSTPELSLRGRSRLATQQTASLDTENQMPRYLLVDTPGEKKPMVNAPLAETSVSLSDGSC